VGRRGSRRMGDGGGASSVKKKNQSLLRESSQKIGGKCLSFSFFLSNSPLKRPRVQMRADISSFTKGSSL
jgi:hypothetical protein